MVHSGSVHQLVICVALEARMASASRQARPLLALRIGIPDILLVIIIGEEAFAVSLNFLT
jgi:hypothetical protein